MSTFAHTKTQCRRALHTRQRPMSSKAETYKVASFRSLLLIIAPCLPRKKQKGIIKSDSRRNHREKLLVLKAMISSISSSTLLAVTAVAFLLAGAPLTVVALNPACELAGCQGGKAPVKTDKANATLSGGGNATSSSTFVVVPEMLLHAHNEPSQPVSVNLPGTMKQHIHTIQEYLANPVQHLEHNNNLLTTLDDLEEELIHADNAREFYALGGWPLLASLVSSKVHASVVAVNSNNNNCGDNDTNENDPAEKVLAIRAAAAWALGSAIKDQNADEFGPWVQEKMDNTTPLEIVVQALLGVSDAADSPGSCSRSTLQFQEELASKTVYALGSFLRGNPSAQVAFSSMSNNPAQVLGSQASKWAEEATETAVTISSNAPMSRHAIRMTQQLLTLANDIVRTTGKEQSTDASNVIITAFTTEDWCHAAMQASIMQPSSSFKRLVFKSLHTTALQAVQTLAPYCSSSETSTTVSSSTVQ
jgi:hypothetical protein